MCVKTQSSYGKEVSKPAKAQTTSVTRTRIEFFQWLYWTYRIPDPIPPSALTQAEGVFSLPERDRVQVEYSGSGMRETLPQSIMAQKQKKCYLRVCDPLPGCHQKETRCLRVVKRSRRSPSILGLYIHICAVESQSETFISPISHSRNLK